MRCGENFAAIAWRSRASCILTLLTAAVLFGPLVWRMPINEIDFTARLAHPSWEHPFGTDDLGQDLLARMLYGGRISLAVGFAAMAVAIIVGVADRRDLGHLPRQRRRRADVDHRPVPGAAATAAAVAGDLSVPGFPQELGRPGRRRLHPDRARDRRLSLDAGGTTGAGAIFVLAREGVRRSGARARRHHAAAGDPAHPAEFARTCDRGRNHRRRGRDHRGIDAVVSRPRFPAGHSDLGAPAVRRQGLSRHRAALGAVRGRRDLR